MIARIEAALIRAARWIVNATQFFFALALLAGPVFGLASCEKAAQGESPEAGAPKAESLAPKVEGETVILSPGAPQAASLSVAEVRLLDRRRAKIPGHLAWNDDLTVRIFSPVGGRVAEIIAKPGQKVARDATLMTISSPDFGQAQADMQKANSDLALANKTLARLKELLDHGAAAQKDVDSAQGDFERAVCEKSRASAKLALYGGGASVIDQLFSLKTPISGEVVERNVNPGQEIRPDHVLANAPQYFAPPFVVTDPARLWVMIDVSELDLAALKLGEPFKLRSRALPGKEFDARLDYIASALDPVTRTVKARGEVDNRDRLLKAEMYVDAEFNESSPAGVAAPLAAVFMKDDAHYLFVEAAPGQFERRAIQIGEEKDGAVQVTSGVGAGQRVVTSGCLLLEDLLESSGDEKS